MLHGLPWHIRLYESKGQRPHGLELEGEPIRDWEALIARTGADAFSKRLDWADLGPEGAQHLIELHPVDGVIPDWLNYLHDLTEALQRNTGEPGQSWFASVDAQLTAMMRAESQPIPYAHALWPVANHALKRMQHHILAARGEIVGVLSSTWDDLALALVTRLSRLLTRSLEELRGPTPYQSFCESLVSNGFSEFLWEFPVAGRMISVICQQWEINASALVERVIDDRLVLQQTFNVAMEAELESVEWALSDPHRGGATVAILRFSGDSPPVVYKPKDLRIEQAYREFSQGLLREFSTADDSGLVEDPIRVHTMGDAYGYASFVSHEPCAVDDLPAFYRQAGRLMAVLHILGASDCHFENLIAHGTDLVLIDAETLFEVQPQVPVAQVMEQVPESVDGWVLSLGMLPSPREFAAGGQLVDVSALGVESSSGKADHEEKAWVDVNTDAMTMGVRQAQVSQPGSIPVSVGTPNPVVGFADELVAGFTDVYQWAMVQENRERIAGDLERFRGIRRRIVMRNTSLYAILQQRATSPSALRSALTRGFELDRLSRSSLLHENRTPLWDAFHAEIEAMERWDIPYFDFDLGDSTIWESETPVKGMMNDDGIHKAALSLQAMCQKDLDWQVSLIRTSISLCDQGQVDAARDVRSPVQTIDIVSAVREIALEDRVGTPTWLSVDQNSQSGQRQLELMKQEIYGGQAGAVALLFAGAQAYGDSGLLEFAERACEPMLRVISDEGMRFRLQRDSGLGIGGYGGILRLLELLTIQGWHPRVASMLPQAVAMIDTSVIAQDSALDVLSGVAGSLPVVARVSAHGERGRGLAVVMARQLMDHQDASGGWTLKSPGLKAQRPLTGLAHGASGMGLALLEAGVVLADERMLEAGAKAFAYEDSVFDQVVGNWPDFRNNTDGSSFMSGWCAGAPGIGLARMRALELLPNHPDAPLWQAALESSAASTIATAVGPRDHLCCGNMGRVAALSLLGQFAGRTDWVEVGQQIAEQVHERALHEHGFALGAGGNLRAGFDTPYLMPAFMQGLSGIAFTSLVGAGSPALKSVLL